MVVGSYDIVFTELEDSDDDVSLDDVRSALSSSSSTPSSSSSSPSPSLALVIAVASFAKDKSDALLDAIRALNEEENGVTTTNENRPKLTVLVIRTDNSDGLEEVAIELGLTSVPSYAVFRDGAAAEVVTSDGSASEAMMTTSGIRAALASASASNGTKGGAAGGGCCPLPSSAPSNGGGCCAPTTPSTSSRLGKDDVLRLVSASYAATLNKSSSCCVSVDSTLMGYSPSDLIKAGAGANLGLGCGNPLSFANIRRGETVLDLGSGAGIDCFLAADAVGMDGTVIGVDMTPDMVLRARDNAAKKGLDPDRVSFRLGEIEFLPVPDGIVDCVVSNCVINLSPDKPRVFREMHRVLKPGGRIAVSDVVTRPQTTLPDELRTEEALAC